MVALSIGKCKNCLCQHKKCNAECCRVLPLAKNNSFVIKPDDELLVMKMALTKDDAWYYKLHGCIVRHGQVTIPLKRFVIEEDETHYLLMRDCDLLKGNLCRGHPHNKPKFCQLLDETDANASEKFYITKNCLVREVKDG